MTTTYKTGAVGVEPTTTALTVRRSAIELHPIAPVPTDCVLPGTPMKYSSVVSRKMWRTHGRRDTFRLPPSTAL